MDRIAIITGVRGENGLGYETAKQQKGPGAAVKMNRRGAFVKTDRLLGTTRVHHYFSAASLLT